MPCLNPGGLQLLSSILRCASSIFLLYDCNACCFCFLFCIRWYYVMRTLRIKHADVKFK